uniref:Uncharacterized protein n=1 Tax=Heterorhabditis bacteriophora TaxID=37862 RepID=A0A1I7XQQ9_HETBA
MAALYCEPKWRTFGLVEPGWRGFGGLLTDPKTSQYIPQYNLGAFWKRRIAPTVAGFVEPVLNPSVMRVRALHIYVMMKIFMVCVVSYVSIATD